MSNFLHDVVGFSDPGTLSGKKSGSQIRNVPKVNIRGNILLEICTPDISRISEVS